MRSRRAIVSATQQPEGLTLLNFFRLSEFKGRLNLERVGINGHSYGGYTALAVAGAALTPNFEQLERDCQTE